MTYQRKTKDEYKVQGYYSFMYGWETVCTEDTLKEGRETLKAYRENEPEYKHRLIKYRVHLQKVF